MRHVRQDGSPGHGTRQSIDHLLSLTVSTKSSAELVWALIVSVGSCDRVSESTTLSTWSFTVSVCF